MAIVQCLTCGRLLYRPDEMTGTAWQCIGCGPTQVSDERKGLPERLAQLLEGEYKRVVWRIYPGSDAITHEPTESGMSSNAAPLIPALQSVSEKPLHSPEPLSGRVARVLWFPLAVAAAYTAVMGLVQRPGQGMILILAAVFALVAGVIALMGIAATQSVAYFRSRQLRRLNPTSAIARTPLTEIKHEPSSDKFHEKAQSISEPDRLVGPKAISEDRVTRE